MEQQVLRLSIFPLCLPSLSAYQQQQQRCLAVWDLIMNNYEDDLELDAENDQFARELKKRRCVSERKDYKKAG